MSIGERHRSVSTGIGRLSSGTGLARGSAWPPSSPTLSPGSLPGELKLRVYDIVKRPVVARDPAFVDQITDAARSGPRNVAEGFGRFNRREFAHFLKIAVGSEHEVRNHIIDACDRGYISAEERDDHIHLARGAIAAAVSLRRYLLSHRNPYQ
ncbi:MAG: four helix bundle protein [Vicinamibacterales bacterium]